MGDVVDIDSRKPHISGTATCKDCNHKWIAVSPVGISQLECPECKSFGGRLDYLIIPKDFVWTCSCGNDLGYIIMEGWFCPVCGKTHPFKIAMEDK